MEAVLQLERPASEARERLVGFVGEVAAGEVLAEDLEEAQAVRKE